MILITLMIVLLIYWIVSAPAPITNVLTCPPGECLTNVYNGIKTCPPTNTETISGDYQVNVCNPPHGCTSPRTPYAVKPDQSTDLAGVCVSNDICRCTNRPQCAEYILSYFSYENGNPFLGVTEFIPFSTDPFAGQRVVFPSVTTGTDILGQIQREPPLQYNNPVSAFCAIPPAWLPRAVSCPRGTLAYLPLDPSAFDRGQLNITPLACVRGSACPPGTIAYWTGKAVACLP